ncbi:hypothetical protein SS50377_21082 [Spironucleus salmonicida]|uniref:Uncharacterized protein n=1 Tax=Spironucleus salmonicida TaxID=348837 RepID=V6LHT8_9EUKA|nr:hypothetical protein SS50377_21082 [Spironucleus salmonicida]|eukprot:EST43868.1 Hypothetical protein SS50377_16168 [Spironucleus salmonicida]
MEARRLLEDYFSDTKLFLFKENNDLYTSHKGLIPLEQAAILAKTNVNILKSAIKDSKTLKIDENSLQKILPPQQPTLASQTIIFGPFSKFTPQKFIKLFALKSGQVCPMLANSYLYEGCKLVFMIFRSIEDKAKFIKNYPETVQEKDYDFKLIDKIWEGVDVYRPTLNNKDFARIHKLLKGKSVCYTPLESRIRGLVFEKDEELEEQKAVKKQKEYEKNEKQKFEKKKARFEKKVEDKRVSKDFKQGRQDKK